MKNFAYARAQNVAAAIQSIRLNSNAKFLAGGTNLVDLMRENIEQPELNIQGKPRMLFKPDNYSTRSGSDGIHLLDTTLRD